MLDLEKLKEVEKKALMSFVDKSKGEQACAIPFTAAFIQELGLTLFTIPKERISSLYRMREELDYLRNQLALVKQENHKKVNSLNNVGLVAQQVLKETALDSVSEMLEGLQHSIEMRISELAFNEEGGFYGKAN